MRKLLNGLMLQRPGRSQKGDRCCSGGNKTRLARDYSKKQNSQSAKTGSGQARGTELGRTSFPKIPAASYVNARYDRSISTCCSAGANVSSRQAKGNTATATQPNRPAPYFTQRDHCEVVIVN